MHESSLAKMSRFVQSYMTTDKRLTVLDVGALDVNGTYRPLFKEHDYTAMDIVPGPNVDIVGWENVTDQYDVVISGQAAEHAEDFITMMKSIGAACKPGGLICVIVPSREQVEHRRPDYWRFTQEGAAKLIDFAGAVLCLVMENGRDVMAVGRVNE